MSRNRSIPKPWSARWRRSSGSRRRANPPSRGRPSRRLAALVLLLAGIAACERGRPTAVSGEWKRLEFAVLEDYDKGEDLSDVARDFALFRELGIRTWRGSFGWDDYEPERGRYDFDWLERFVELAHRRGIRLRPYVAYTPEWAATKRLQDGAFWNDPPARVEDWRRFVAALASSLRDHPNVLSYEIYNEVNVPEWWDGTSGEYHAVLRSAAEAIRAADPDAQVILAGLVWPDPDWLERVCASDAHAFDAAPFHAYPETWTPDSVRVESYLGTTYGHFLEAADACGGKPVWINETGYATVPGRSERDQARWWARAIATFAAAPRVSLIGVYEIKDLRPDREAIGGAANYHLGLTTTERRKKLAFHTVALLARFFDAESVRVEDPRLTVTVHEGSAQGIEAHVFRRPDGRQLLVLWSRSGETAVVDVTFPRGGRSARSYALAGRGTPVSGWSGRTLRGLGLAPGEVKIIEVRP